MIDQLQLLEQTILELKARYNVTATELVNLKHKLAHDDAPRQITELQSQLDRANTHNSHLNREIDELTKTKDREISELTKAKDLEIDELTRTKESLNAQIEKLHQQNQELLKQNQELNEKNALAISRAEVIQEWLTKIDNQTL